MPRGRIALLALAAVSLVAGIAGGLARLGAPLDVPAAAAAHGALMVGGFLGTVISLERAVALGMRFAYGAPLASGAALLLALLGFARASAGLMLLAPLVLLAASVAIARRQLATHTALLAVAAVAWGIGNALHAYGQPHLAYAWWFTFLVATIAAERLELTRLARRRPLAHPLFAVACTALFAGAALGSIDAVAGAVVFGGALAAMAAWLAAFDIARRTVRMGGFARYAALALLGGYAWLAAGGIAWAAAATVAPAARDAAIHAIGLGFVFSMILAHAPLIVPVIARKRMRYTPAFYAPLALLHASLLLRLAGGALDAAARLWGGALNAAALAVFILLLLHSLRGSDAPD